MSQVLTQNAINSLLTTSSAGLTTVNFEIALLDLLILETDHYLGVEDVMNILNSSRNDLSTYLEDLENDE